MLTKYLFSFLQDFAQDEEANLTVEYVFMFPLLVWTYVAMFAFFDAFKVRNTNLTAAYTISDMLSRNEGIAIDMNYINGLHSVFDFLTPSNDPTWIRVTSFSWNSNNDLPTLHWSRGTGGTLGRTQAELEAVADRIPLMAHGGCAVLVETSMNYDPVFNIELSAFTMNNFIVTRTRFQGVPFLPFTGEGTCLP